MNADVHTSHVELSARTDRLPVGPVAFAGLVAFTAILLVAPQTFVPALGALRIAALSAGVALAAFAFDRVALRAPILVLPHGAWPALALGVWALATAPLSYWPGGSVSLFLDLYVKALLVFWLIPRVVDTQARLRRLVTILFVLGTPIAATALWNYANGVTAVDGANRIAGYGASLAANPNDLALLLNLLLPLGASLLGVVRSRPARLAIGALCLLDAAGIVATFSRAGFITLALVGTAYVLRSLRGVRRVIAALGLVATLAAFALVPAGYAERLGTTVDAESDATGSAQARLREMQAATRVVAAHPIVGAGLGMSILPMTAETGGWRMVHDVYFQYAADLGLPGLALFVGLVAASLGAARAARRRRERPMRDELAKLASGIELSLWAFVVAAVFHPAGYHFYFYYVAGLAFAARGVRESEGAR